jgi:hypothetical protein
MEVQHASAIGLNYTKMVRNMSKDAEFLSVGSKETMYDSFADVVKESSDSFRI